MKNSLAVAVAATVVGLSFAGCATGPWSGGGSSAHAIVSEDFESTAVGAIPAGFTKTGAVGVEEGVAHSGTHALRMEPAVRGGRYISLDPDKVAALGGEHWGRLYYKVKTPTPMPTGALIHATLVDGKATSPLAKDTVDVRLATLLFYPTGQFNYFYNVQPPKGRQEFGPKSTIPQTFTDDWVLLEWHVDYATQTYEFFVNGKKIDDISQHKGAGNFEGIEIPAKFDTMSFGFTNYQPATGEGFTVWIDDIAVGKQRLGPVRAGG